MLDSTSEEMIKVKLTTAHVTIVLFLTYCSFAERNPNVTAPSVDNQGELLWWISNLDFGKVAALTLVVIDCCFQCAAGTLLELGD